MSYFNFFCSRKNGLDGFFYQAGIRRIGAACTIIINFINFYILKFCPELFLQEVFYLFATQKIGANALGKKSFLFSIVYKTPFGLRSPAIANKFYHYFQV